VEIRLVTLPVCYGPSGGISVRGHLRCEIVDGHRYADDPEPSWYKGAQYPRSADPDVSGSHALGGPPPGAPGSAYDSGIHERPSGAFRLPEQRPAATGYPLTDPLSASGSHALPVETEKRSPYDTSSRIPVRGPEYPTIRPAETPVPAPATYGAPARTDPPTYGAPAKPEPVAEPTALVPPIATDRYAAPAPGVAESVYRTRRTPSSFVVAIGMVILLVPVVRLLLHATFTGAPTAGAIVPAVLLTLGFVLTGIGLFALAGSRPVTREDWLRPPIAYLPAGLLLLLAAGLAAA
jgi:hypothetical protein